MFGVTNPLTACWLIVNVYRTLFYQEMSILKLHPSDIRFPQVFNLPWCDISIWYVNSPSFAITHFDPGHIMTQFLSRLFLKLLFLLFHYSSWSPSTFESMSDSWWYELCHYLCRHFWEFLLWRLFNFRDVIILVCAFCTMPQAHGVMRQLDPTKMLPYTILQTMKGVDIRRDFVFRSWLWDCPKWLFFGFWIALPWQYLIIYVNSRMRFNLPADFIVTWPDWMSVFSTETGIVLLVLSLWQCPWYCHCKCLNTSRTDKYWWWSAYAVSLWSNQTHRFALPSQICHWRFLGPKNLILTDLFFFVFY